MMSLWSSGNAVLRSQSLLWKKLLTSAGPLASQQWKGLRLVLLPCFLPRPQVLMRVVAVQVTVMMWIVPRVVGKVVGEGILC